MERPPLKPYWRLEYSFAEDCFYMHVNGQVVADGETGKPARYYPPVFGDKGWQRDTMDRAAWLAQQGIRAPKFACR